MPNARVTVCVYAEVPGCDYGHDAERASNGLCGARLALEICIAQFAGLLQQPQSDEEELISEKRTTQP